MLGKDGFAGGSPSGADGRFTLTVEPGEYTLQARAPARATASMPLSVGEAGLSDVRVEMEPGREIVGRLVDAAGRGAGGFLVLATAADGEGDSAHTQPDGTFRIVGLTAVTHTVVGGSELAGLGFVKGVTPGGDPVTVRLQPAGEIAVRVVDATGAPVKDAYPAVDRIDGVRVRLPGRVSGPTDANGHYTLASPAGGVEVEVRSGTTLARGAVAVVSGQTASLQIALPPAAAP